MSRPLRCSLIIPSSVGAIRRAVMRPDVWTRTLRAMGYRLSDSGFDQLGDPLRVGQVFRLVPDSGRPIRKATLTVVAVDEMPVLTLQIGPLVAATVRLQLAATAAGTLATVDFQVDTPSAIATIARRQLLEFGQMLLGIITVTARDVQIVVAGAVIQGDRVLAARRTRPADLAGLWEMPGGKVEPGEGEREALAREFSEELGIVIKVGEPVGEPELIGDGLELRTYFCGLVSGSPKPMERHPAHDEVRWLTGSDMAKLAWLPGDRPFVQAVMNYLKMAADAQSD